MDITYEEYEKAKSIVQAYEEHLRHMEQDEDDFDDGLDDWEREEEIRAEEDAEKAATCTCGAWVFGKNGGAIHVADCFCGAE